MAPPGSWWARRFYTDEQRARAGRPFRAQRSPAIFALWTGALVTAIAVFGFVAARPAPLLGVDEAAVGKALPHRGGGLFFELWPPLGPCQPLGPGRWGCSIYDQEGSGGTVSYRVEVDDLGCWTAVPTEGGGRGEFASCLRIFQYL